MSGFQAVLRAQSVVDLQANMSKRLPSVLKIIVSMNIQPLLIAKAMSGLAFFGHFNFRIIYTMI